MNEKLGDQMKIMLEKIQKIEEKQDSDLEHLKQQNKQLEEKIKNYKQLNKKQLEEMEELNKKIKELENNKCVTIEDLENHFGKRIKGFNDGQPTKVRRLKKKKKKILTP